ncbi:RNA polymerase sigma factor [Sulfuriferula plumbiphila]|uniref:RNA polymerase sigma factor n=1 Tax=Sulfuriferula plumbiphila TaxID=171865 RepID=A0A512L4S6_9PROT|nr:sigma-70 family RNA polymerase sigma factor [Sulfuriferula plumbiphila]BBP03196.1 RNA polymerase sigma factor [Sulfuriferula plumbiphila]GEP29483.1 RNA polymerase sigma factor [Sulfuriferula plumbiphila]
MNIKFLPCTLFTIATNITDPNHMLPPSAEDPLINLLSRCALRDQQAFERLYRVTSAKLFAVALRIVRRQDWAEEVLQEAFVNIWHHAPGYVSGKAAPLTWMTHIVRNRALDWLRRPQREDAADEDAEETWKDESASLFERLEQSRDATALNDCMGRIEARLRQTIALAFWHGLTHSELAQHMQQPIGTVKTWIRRGMGAIKKCLEDSHEV